MTSGALVLGVLNGLTIGLLAAGLVLVYKSNKFLNLAHAQMGALSALLLSKFVIDWGWNWWVAFALALVIGLATGLLVERFLVRPLRRRTKSPLRLLLLSVGVSQLLLSVTFIPDLSPDFGRTQTGNYPQPFRSNVDIGGVSLTGMNVLTAILVPLLVVALALFMGYTLFGKQIRAAANNPDAARLCGISVSRVSAVTWVLAGGFSAVSAIMEAPNQPSVNVSALGPFLLMMTLGAAAFGAFASLPGALAGGLFLGVVYQVVSAEAGNATTAGLWAFAVILIVVLVRGRAIARVFELSSNVVEELPVTRIAASIRHKAIVRFQPVWLGVIGVVALVAWPHLPGFGSTGDRFNLTVIVIYALVGMSLTMLLGWGGQVSLGNFALVGLGAYLTARWSADWTLLAMIFVIGAIGAAVLVLVGLPALRIRGLTLAVTTLGLAVISHDWLYHQEWIGGPNPLSRTVEWPKIGLGLGSADSQYAVYHVAVIVLVLACAMSAALRRSSPGRIFIAVRDNERASAAFGVSPAAVKLAILAVSGFFSAVAGVLWAVSWRSISVSQFTPDFSTAILAIPIIGGLGSISGTVVAGVMLYGLTVFLGPELSGLFGTLGQNLGFNLFLAGAGSVGVVMHYPNGMAGEAQKRWQHYLDGLARRTERAVATADVSMPIRGEPDADMATPLRVQGVFVNGGGVVADEPDADMAMPLRVRGVHVRFGGVVALDEPDLEVRAGEIVGLIGTNGAGKTTLMNVISGAMRPDRGSVLLFEKEVVDFAPDIRAGYGLARSFQDASLFAGLTVRETIQVALAQRHKIGIIPAMVAAPWVRYDERQTRRQADEIIARFGLLNWADAHASELSTGTRRICDLAAQVAARPKLILLDEPTAGVAQREAEAFGPLLRQIRDELNCAVLIVEHDMPLLMGLCDRVYALEAGAVIAEGTSEEIRNNPRVVASYLGTEEAAITRSGAMELA